jgi:hypothetical protein
MFGQRSSLFLARALARPCLRLPAKPTHASLIVKPLHSFLSSRSFSLQEDKKKSIDEQKAAAQSPSSSSAGMIGSAALAGSVLFGKAKYVLLALKVTKLSSVASMLLSSAAYGFIFGWPYGIGMVGLIFVHECGHALAMLRHKIPFTPMVFVPFMGASIGMTEHAPNAGVEAEIALAGPILGSCAALSLGVVGDVSDSQLLLALAHWGYLINLFNLLPGRCPLPPLPLPPPLTAAQWELSTGDVFWERSRRLSVWWGWAQAPVSWRAALCRVRSSTSS